MTTQELALTVIDRLKKEYPELYNRMTELVGVELYDVPSGV